MGAAIDEVIADDVEKVYGRQRALGRVSLRLRQGEATLIAGPNGAGKSTLLSILSTAIAPSKGRLRFSGGAEDDPRERRDQIGVVAHDSLCYGDLTGRENLRFFARLYQVADWRRRADEWIDKVALGEAAERPSRTYSRGMLQRLSLARALVHEPTLLLCDEPFTGLDRNGVEILRQILSAERARGAILVVVSHDFDAVAGLVDRMVVLKRGLVAHDGAAPRTGAELEAAYQLPLSLQTGTARG